MFIEPMNVIDNISGAGGISSPGKTGATGAAEGLFKGLFENAVNDVVTSDATVAADVQALTTGQTDDLHTLGIDMAKAQLSISLLVQMRNRFMDSYNELMRMNL